jgi:4-amino-4-deoxy-L-arabinose transferase-like glycosyltransferase
MPLNPFYDAAVRSMGSSWHAFLLGAFNPNATVTVDKPPLDLWLQVASTKLLGFTPFALLLPTAIASSAAVLLLYDLVRRCFGRTAGLAAAAALAVLPAEVLTARSDTMDATMAALLVLAAWLVVRGVERERSRELYIAGAVVGLAFEAKLFEALVPLPALVLLFWVGSSARRRTRVKQLAGAGAVAVCVGLAWPLLFALSQVGGKPFPLGSSHGSIWSTVFGYNGINRVTGTSTHSALDRLSPPGAGRLLAAGPIHLNALVGTTLVPALAVGCGAVVLGLVRRRSLGRVPFALAVAMGVWLALAGALLSFISHVPVRYLEVLLPAIAATFGVGLALVARAAAGGALERAHGRAARLLAAVTLVGVIAAALVYASGVAALPLVAVAAALAAAGLLAWTYGHAQRAAAGAITALAVTAMLAVPTSHAITVVTRHQGDGGALGAMPPQTVTRLSHYLTSHRGGARYEFAVAEAHLAGPLIVADAQPVMVLAGTPYHELIGPRALAAAVHAGQVRYVLLAGHGHSHPVRAPTHPARTPRGQLAAWVRTHGVDVTRSSGMPGYGALYRVA